MSEHCPHTGRVDALYDRASGDAESRWMADHAPTCPDCARRLRQNREVSASFGTFVPEGMPNLAKARLAQAVRRAFDDEYREPARFAWEMTGLAASVLVAASIWLATLPATASAEGTAATAWEQAAATGGRSLVTAATATKDTDIASLIVSNLADDGPAPATEPKP